MTNSDSDGDRSLDGYEVANEYDPCSSESNPTCSGSPDSDGDGIDDGLEVKGYGTSPTESDSDGDGCPDWLEIMDINGDRKVDLFDVNLLHQRVIGHIPADDSVSESVFDVDKDGDIDADDETLMAANT